MASGKLRRNLFGILQGRLTTASLPDFFPQSRRGGRNVKKPERGYRSGSAIWTGGLLGALISSRGPSRRSSPPNEVNASQFTEPPAELPPARRRGPPRAQRPGPPPARGPVPARARR